MRIAILGANGQIGKILFESIAKQFPMAELLACVRKQHLHFEGVAGNHLQRSVVFSPCENEWGELGKLNVLINCIGSINENKNSFEEVHILPVLKMLDNKNKVGNPKIIQVSALGASVDSISRFLRTKSFADEMLLQQENTFVIRPSIVCTHNTMLVKSIHQLQKMARFTSGKTLVPENFLNTKIQPVDPRDIADVVCKIINEEITERKIDLPGPEIISLEELFHLAHLRPIKISQKSSDRIWRLTKYFCKSILSNEQYQLLKKDNIADYKFAEKTTGQKFRNTKSFWENELSPEKINVKRKFQKVVFE
jgi:uncharacterized protein YbjT (DUF2867 family)